MELKKVVTSIETMCSLNCAELEVTRLEWISNLSIRLNAFYRYQIFALDSAVVEVQEMFSWHGGHLTNAMYHHGETL